MTDAANREVILSVRDLNVKFSLRGQQLNALRGISLDLYKSESLAIVGESGSGKSVFVKNFNGLLDKNGLDRQRAHILSAEGKRGGRRGKVHMGSCRAENGRGMGQNTRQGNSHGNAGPHDQP